MKTVRKDMVIFGTLDFTVHAVSSIEKYHMCTITLNSLFTLNVIGKSCGALK